MIGLNLTNSYIYSFYYKILTRDSIGLKIIVAADADSTLSTGHFRRVDMVMTAKHVINLVELLFEDVDDTWAMKNRDEFDNFFSAPYHFTITQSFGHPDGV
jgi:hypothetical protein